MEFIVKCYVFVANAWKSLIVSLLSSLAIDMMEVSEGEFYITNECRVSWLVAGVSLVGGRIVVVSIGEVGRSGQFVP